MSPVLKELPTSKACEKCSKAGSPGLMILMDEIDILEAETNWQEYRCLNCGNRETC